ncbi:MAG: DUF362 domain-containing protein, partial [Anaerolineae bacterium]
MSPLDRREFLRCCALGLGALVGGPVLAACRPRPSPTPVPGSSPTPPPASPTPGFRTPSLSPAPSATPTAAPEYPHLAVARGGEPEDLVRRAIHALGGMGRFIRPGADVIIKPNICVAYHTYEYAVTTNPWVVGALVRMCYEAGARRVWVMDHPFGGTPEEAYARSGIADQVRAAGGEMEIMARFKFRETEIPEGLDLRRCAIYEDILILQRWFQVSLSFRRIRFR